MLYKYRDVSNNEVRAIVEVDSLERGSKVIVKKSFNSDYKEGYYWHLLYPENYHSLTEDDKVELL